MKRKLKPLYFMTDDGGAGNGAGEGSGDGGAGGAGATTGSGSGEGAGTDEGKTFTQADIDRIIAGRLSKFADYDEIKTKLAEVEKANQTESEKAIAAAKEEARQAALAEAAPRLVAAEFRAAAAGRMTAEQLKELTEDLDMSKYLTESGEVDVERIKKKVDALAPAEKKAAPSFGGGARKAADKPEPGAGLDRMRQAYADSAK